MAKKNEPAKGGDSTPPANQPDGGTPTPPTAPDYSQDINSLKETITKQGETIGQLQEYVGLSSTLINTIASDPNLSNQVRSAVAGQQGVQGQQQNQNPTQNQNNNQPTGTPPEYLGKVDDVVASQREAIIKDFERSYGIDQLPSEEQKKVKQSVASYLGDFGWEVPKIPLTNLRSQLDKAYMGSVGIDKLREEGKLEGVVQARENAFGAMGGFAGGAPSPDSQGEGFSSKQVDWLSRLRVDPDKAKKTYAERGNEQEREKPVKE